MLGLLFPSLLLVFCVILLVYSRGYPLQARLLPWIVLIPTIVMLLWEIGKKILERTGKRQVGIDAGRETPGEGVSRNRGIVAMVWLAAFLLGMYLFGLLIGIFLFILAYARLNHARWRDSIVVPLLVLVFMYGFFVVFMKLYIYPGVLTQVVMTWIKFD